MGLKIKRLSRGGVYRRVGEDLTKAGCWKIAGEG
jgi:hypothetical protein